MSVSRQQRRAMERKLAGISDKSAEGVILALRDAGNAQRHEVDRIRPEIERDVMRIFRERIEPEIRAQAQGDLITLILAFEHIDRRHTGKWLAQWLHDFNSFGDAVNDSGASVAELRDILREECGLDVEKEFADCERESAGRKRKAG